MRKIWRVVVTGELGSAVEHMRGHFEAHGYYVLVMQEIAREFFTSGLKIEKNGITNYAFQKEIFEEQLYRESRYMHRIAKVPGDKKLLIFERGAMDRKAYLEDTEFTRMIHQKACRVAELRDERYDGIFHLERAMSPVFKETSGEGAVKDLKVCQAWVGHPHLRIIKNNIYANKKIQNLALAIERLLGIPEPLEIERKFLVKFPNLYELVNKFGAVPLNVEQVYLQKKKNIRQRIRRRAQDGYSVFSSTYKERIEDGVSREVEERISELEYRIRSRYERDRSRRIVRKDRYCFLWNGQYFELDIFHQPKRHSGLALMEIELEQRKQHVDIPPFISVIREVTSDPDFSSSSLAKK